jgi:hypothetical protein
MPAVSVIMPGFRAGLAAPEAKERPQQFTAGRDLLQVRRALRRVVLGRARLRRRAHQTRARSDDRRTVGQEESRMSLPGTRAHQ